MTLKYALLADDYLQYYLFAASQNKQVKKITNRTRLLLGVALLLTGLATWQGNRIVSVVVLVAALPAYFLFPFSMKRRYKRIYQRIIAEKHKDEDAEVNTVVIDDNHITTFDSGNNFSFDITQLKEITEVGNYIYLRMKSGTAIIIPVQKVEQLTELRTELKAIAGKQNVPVVSLPDWKW